jgi:acyl-coenzyme A synthetase/AMP-(fatty) acid ligase
MHTLNNTKNITEYLVGVDSQYHDKILYHWEEKTLTFGQAKSLVYQLAGYISSTDLKPRDYVLVVLDDCPELALYFLALVLLGQIPVLVNTRLAKDEIQNIASSHNCKGIVATDDILSYINAPVKFTKEQLWSAPADLPYTAYQYQPTDDVVHFMTSGTSLSYKTVVYDHSNIANLDRNEKGIWTECTDASVVYCPAKMTTAIGFYSNIYLPWMVKSTHVINGKVFDLRNMMDIVNRYQVDYVFTLPFILNLMLKRPGIKFDPCLKHIIAAGEPLPPNVATEFLNRFGIRIQNLFGLTEGFAIFTNLDPTSDISLPGTPVDGVEVRIVREDGSDCEPNEAGRMIFKSANMANRYYNDINATNECFKDGWYWTNDLFVRDNCGTYKFIDRINQCVKIRGVWTSSTDIENVVSSMPGVVECTATFEKSKEGFSEPVVFVVRDTDLVNAITIKAFVGRASDQSTLIPQQIYFVDNLPKTLNNKKIKIIDKLLEFQNS